jgi:hypothetical protein
MIYTRRRLMLVAVATAAAAFAAGADIQHQAAAQAGKAINTLNGPKGVAIKGYDPVAYFVAGKPMRGLEQHSVTHAGARWLFASAENKALFEHDPAKYVPAYGGYCAYGVAQGYLVKIEPDAWAIRNGKLYLNYDRGVQKQWNAAPDKYIADAEKKWPRLVGSR